MKAIISIGFLLVTGLILSAQTENVGIGTNNPSQKLHVRSTGLGIPSIGLFQSDASSAIWLDSPFGQSKAITFREGGNNVANIAWNSGIMKVYSDYSGIIPQPTLTMSSGYKMGINMGILGEPDQKLTVNGKIRLGDDLLTATEGTIRYDTATNSFQGFNGSGWRSFGGDWSKVVTRLYYDQGPVFIGRSSNIGFEAFGVRYPVIGADLGGMHVETNGHTGGKPFYGYAIDGVSKMYHYFDGGSNAWRVNNNGDRLILLNNGYLGIGVTNPQSRLHVEGGNWAVMEEEGDFKIGSLQYRLVMGVATEGEGAGDARIYAKGGNKRLILGAESSDILSILANGVVGIGNIEPEHVLDIQAHTQIGVRVANDYSGFNTKYGINANASDLGTGTKYGVRGSATANVTSTNSKNIYGVYGFANGNSSDATVYGLAGIVHSSGTGNKYGIYAEAGTTDPSITTKSFAFYAKGHSYFHNDVRIGTIAPASGYKLLVDGKILSEEIKVQMSENWPDYVFDKSYELTPLSQLKRFIEKNNHLPGIPSAQKVAEENGIELGEMNRLLLEKVEELTLHVIRLQEEMDALKKVQQ